MAPTRTQQDWVDRVILGRVRDRDQDTSDLLALKAESQAVRSSSRALPGDFEKIRNLFIRLSTMVDDAAATGSLSKLSELKLGANGSPTGQVQRAAPPDFDILGGLFQDAFASATAAAPSDFLLKLAQLGAGAGNDPRSQPRATTTQFSEIAQGFIEALSASSIELSNLLALAEL